MRAMFLTLLVFATVTAPATADQLIRAARVHTVSGGVIAPGEVLVGDDGMIAWVGAAQTADAPQAELIDLGELDLYPGLIAASSSLGLTEIAAVKPSNDYDEIGENTARLLAYRAINPDSELIPVARQNGITHVQVVPGGSGVRGRSGILRTVGWTWEERLEVGPSGLHLDWPSMSLNRGPDAPAMKDQIADRRERVAQMDRLVEAARAYATTPTDGIDRDLELEAWAGVIDRSMPVFVHAQDERQILAAIDWAGRYDLRLVISGGREAWRVADALAAADVPVILEQVMDLPSRDFDLPWSGYRRAGLLHDAGVRVVIALPPGSYGDSVARNLPFHAGMARAHGLDDDAALASITLTAAQVLGIGDRLGSIEVGKQASLIAVRGDLLEITDPVVRMWIAGKEVSLENRHTRLAERYRSRPGPAAAQGDDQH